MAENTQARPSALLPGGAKRVLIIQQYIPLYDGALYEKLVRDYGYNVVLAADIETDHPLNQYNGDVASYKAVNIGFTEILGTLWSSGILRAASRFKPDAIIILGAFRHLALPLILASWRLRSVPVAVWGMFHTNIGPTRRVSKVAAFLSAKLADLCLVYGQRGARELASLGIPGTKIRIVSTGVDLVAVDRALNSYSNSDMALLISSYSLSGKVIFLQVARLTVDKRTDFVISAMREVVSRHPATVLVVLGDGPEKADLLALVQKLEIRANIVFVPSTFDERALSMWFRSARAVVCGGAVGLLAHHAMAHGTPVIAHDDLLRHGPEAEGIIHNKTGLLYRCGDKRALSEKLCYAIVNPELMREMGRQGRDNVVTKYNLASKAQNFHCAIQEMVTGRPGTTGA